MAAVSSPTMRVVSLSAMKRTADTKGPIRLTQKCMGFATMRVLTRAGSEMAIVLGVASPSSNSRGTITTVVINAARSTPYRVTSTPVRIAVAATFTTWLPQRMAMIRRRG